MQELLRTYLKKLTNLSANNRSILLLRLNSDQFMDIHDFDYAGNKPSFSIVEGLVAGRKKVPLCQQIDSRDAQGNELARKLKRLHRVERFIFEERGARDLYVGWPFIHGKLSNGNLIRCPLIFFPVELVLENNEWQLRIREDVNITLNKSFLLAYAHFNEVTIPDEILERVFDDFEKDSRLFRTSLYELMKESPVELNFNQENFIDRLISFRNFRKDEFEKEYETGTLKLYPEAVLGVFPQAGSYLVPDYQTLLEKNQYKDLESFFLDHTSEEVEEEGKHSPHFYIDHVREELTFTPLPLDAFQENAIKAVKRGNSLVVQGPPGTGKSQLICNLIADFLARGKKVLLVCQKRAALDVVYQRLSELGMDPFLALVHDFKNDRKTIYQQIAEQIDSIPDFQSQNNSLDMVQLERKFQQSSRVIDQLTEELEDFKQALFDESECGVSVKELYLTSSKEDPVINIKQEYRKFRMDDLQGFIQKLRDFAAYHRLYGADDYFWKGRKSFAAFGVTDLMTIEEVARDVVQYHHHLEQKTEKILKLPLDFETCLYINQNKDKILQMLELLKSEQVYDYFQHVFPAEKELDVLWLNNTERVLMECYKGLGPETSLPADQLGKFQEALQHAIDSRKNVLKWMRWSLFSKDKFFINRVLVSNGLQNNRKGFNTLVEKIDNRLNLEHNITKLRANKWLKDIPASYDKIHFQTWFFQQKKVFEAKSIFSSLRNFKEYFNIPLLSYEEFRGQLHELLEVFDGIPEKQKSWERYLSPALVHQLLYEPQILNRAIQTLQKDFDSLAEFDRLKENLNVSEDKVIRTLLEESEDDSENGLQRLFENSLRIAWIDHIETKFPILRTVSGLKFDRTVRDLQNAVLEKQEVSTEILLSKVKEETYTNVEYNRLQNMVTYRDLHHQVTKKRRIWPIRRLLFNFSEEIFQLVPCWMASPESVSALFPMEEIFDLVIFDEASQCFAETGIPAMYRGKEVVVAGDDKQLTPNELYRVRWEEEEEHPDAEVDSLLHLADKYLMQVQLRGHYRSKSLDLIDFSNRYFYHGKLLLLPDYLDINSREPAIGYIKVDGTWEDNINQREAEEVADLMVKLIRSGEKKDIGVVTFNAKQQMHILDVLDERFLAEKITPEGRIFVKNIENVQGDEMDIIIFSTAYAPDPSGKLMLQFGSLNAAGGENRLNVAVTRAREKIYVISSILPTQLHVEETKNQGPKLFKAYLEYALSISEGHFKPTLYPSGKHPNDWYLKRRLIEMPLNKDVKWELIEELPFADLTVREDDRYMGLILTDDNLYEQSISVKESHVYMPFTLEKKHWQNRRFFSRNYWNDKTNVEEQLMRLFGDTHKND